MSGLARLLLAAGPTVSGPVSGSDAKASDQTEALARLGARIAIGHRAENVPSSEATVILSTAIAAENPERLAAQQLGCPLWHRSELLRYVLHHPVFGHQHTVGVTGSHGKTTLTGMIGAGLQGLAAVQPEWMPTIVAGGLLPGGQTNACLGALSADGKRRVAVAELDESDRSLPGYQPSISVITNLELDHPDHYPGGLEDLLGVMTQYVQGLPPQAHLVLSADCPVTRQWLARHPAPPGVSLHWLCEETEGSLAGLPGRGVVVEQIQPAPSGGYQGRVRRVGSDTSLAHLCLSVPGRHNVRNAAMAVMVADLLGVDTRAFENALNAFSGMGRRFEQVGARNGAIFIDDYGHHPTEVSATLEAARTYMLARAGDTDRMPALTVVFQPHRYSRLMTFWDAFTGAFSAADHVYITDVYGAGEAPLPGVDAERLVQALKHPQARYLPKAAWASFPDTLHTHLQPGDLVMSMGAGDVTQLFREAKSPITTVPALPMA
jgi:UDP-N-acetylmuramate--alanine ligase